MCIRDRNRIAVNTAEFIKERLQIIEHELGSVETDIEDLKRANNGVCLLYTSRCV